MLSSFSSSDATFHFNSLAMYQSFLFRGHAILEQSIHSARHLNMTLSSSLASNMSVLSRILGRETRARSFSSPLHQSR